MYFKFVWGCIGYREFNFINNWNWRKYYICRYCKFWWNNERVFWLIIRLNEFNNVIENFVLWDGYGIGESCIIFIFESNGWRILDKLDEK